MRGVGLRTQGINGLAGGNPAHGRLESGNALTNGVWFAFRKTSASDSSADTEVVLRFGGATQTLVGAEAFAEGVTYLCVAEISVGENGATARAFATAIDDYDNIPAEYLEERSVDLTLLYENGAWVFDTFCMPDQVGWIEKLM